MVGHAINCLSPANAARSVLPDGCQAPLVSQHRPARDRTHLRLPGGQGSYGSVTCTLLSRPPVTHVGRTSGHTRAGPFIEGSNLVPTPPSLSLPYRRGLLAGKSELCTIQLDKTVKGLATGVPPLPLVFGGRIVTPGREIGEHPPQGVPPSPGSERENVHRVASPGLQTFKLCERRPGTELVTFPCREDAQPTELP